MVDLADAERGKGDLIQEFVSSVTSIRARLNGQRRFKRMTARLIAALQYGEEGDYPSQT